ncbi:MAG: hypothetical protein ABIR33_15025 [Pyrinomonadaceae bacterium]
MRNIIWDFEFLYDMVRKGGPVAVLGGIAAIVLGLLFAKLIMVVVGAIVIFTVCVDYVIRLISGKT